MIIYHISPLSHIIFIRKCASFCRIHSSHLSFSLSLISVSFPRIQKHRRYLSPCACDNNKNCLNNRTGQRSAFSWCPSHERTAYLSTREWIYAHCVFLRAPDRHMYSIIRPLRRQVRSFVRQREIFYRYK